MKAKVGYLLAGLMFSPFLVADVPLPGDTLGRLEAVLDHCAKVSPQAAAKFEEGKKLLIAKATPAELAETRASKPYQEAYEQASADIGKEPADQVTKTCTAALAGGA